MASRTAPAHAWGSGSRDSITAFVMNQPTLSCHRSSRRLWTGSTARSGTPAISADTRVSTETATENIRCPRCWTTSSKRASSTSSRTSRTSTTSGCGVETSPSGSGKVGIEPPPASRISAQRRLTASGAGGIDSRSALWSAKASTGASAAAGSRPARTSSRQVIRSRASTSSDQASVCAWSSPMTSVGWSEPAPATTRRWDGRAYGAQASSRTTRSTSRGRWPSGTSCSSHRPGSTATSCRRTEPSSPAVKTVRRVPCRATTASQAAVSWSVVTARGSSTATAIHEPGRCPSPTCRPWSKETGS